MVISRRCYQHSSTLAEVGDLRVQFEQALDGAREAALGRS